MNVTLRKARELLTILCAVIVVAVAFPMAKTAYAAVPEPYDIFYANDYAEVLSQETINYIININDQLYDATGAQVVVSTVNFTDGATIENYIDDMYNAWGIGSSDKNNGVLLVLYIMDDDYRALQGYGLERTFPSSDLDAILNEYLEPDFAVAQYDAGVKKTFDAIVSKLSKIYGYSFAYNPNYVKKTDQPNTSVNQNYEYNNTPQQVTSHQQESRSEGGINMFAWILFFFVVIIILSSLGNRRRYHGGGGYYPPPRRSIWWWGGHRHKHHPPHHHHNPPPPPPMSGGRWGGSASHTPSPPPPLSNNRSGGGGSSRGGSVGRSGGGMFGGSSNRSGGFGGGGGNRGGSFGGGGGNRSGGGGMSRGGSVGRRK